MMSTSSLTIGWIGAGRMGSQLVTRLLAPPVNPTTPVNPGIFG
jgi:pyrroline-5-carboxylate reductase